MILCVLYQCMLAMATILFLENDAVILSKKNVPYEGRLVICLIENRSNLPLKMISA